MRDLQRYYRIVSGRLTFSARRFIYETGNRTDDFRTIIIRRIRVPAYACHKNIYAKWVYDYVVPTYAIK